MNLSAAVEQVAQQRADHPALVFEGRSLSYAALVERARRVAGLLARRGVTRGDRVGLLLPNTPAFPVAFLAALRLGAIAVPFNPGLTEPELRGLLQDAGVRLLVTTPGQASALAVERLALEEDGEAEPTPAPPMAELPPEAPAVIVYSSGTTGAPKGVTLSHHNVLSNVRTNVEECGFTAEDRVLLFMPLFHCYGLNVILNSGLLAGATLILERRFDPERTPRTIARERVSLFFGVPTTFIVLLQREDLQALRSLRYCYCAAAPLPEEIEDQWRLRTGLLVHQAYGLSEASPCVSYNHVREHRRGTIGQPSAGVQVRVVDPESGRELPPGEVGELQVKGPGVMLGYWGRPEATAQVLVDGWLRTGDLGRWDERGYLVLTDRLKDMIIVGGLKVYPAEVEGALYQHPAVAEAAVIGVPDPVMGERVRACLSLKRGQRLTPEDLEAFLRTRLAEYKRPTSVRLLDSLPKGRTGKILRRVLREQAREAGEPERPWSRSALQDWLLRWLRAELDVARVATDAPFAELGVDSLMAVRLAEALTALLGREVPTTVTWLYTSPAQLAAHLGAPPPPAPPALDEQEALRLLELELDALGFGARAGEAS
ncbi:MAG: AMP-binding protein [Alphaproteobacteria bacterium]|nr:AMP-binding protein [Alphaproteobacteria bacterium]